jgi:heme-degrading monooxygenase HmoA
MFARVTTFQIQPGKLDEVIRLFESLAPKSEQGFVSGLLLTDRAANKAITVTLWETLADLNASDTYRQQQLASSQVAALLAGAPVTEVCEVAVRV